MLGGVPGGALEQLVARLRAVVHAHNARPRLRPGGLHPAGQPGPHRLAEVGDAAGGRHAARQPLPQPGLRQLVALHRFHEGQAQTEDVPGEISQRARALRRRVAEPVVGQRAHQVGGDGQDAVEPRGQLGRGQGRSRAPVHPEQGCIAFGVPAVNHPVAHRHGRHQRHAEPVQLLSGLRPGLHIHGIELDPPGGAQLSRPGAGGSAGAIVQARAHGAHRPWNVGVCLFAKAVTPARKSSV